MPRDEPDPLYMERLIFKKDDKLPPHVNTICDFCNKDPPVGEKFIRINISYYKNFNICKKCFKIITMQYFHAPNTLDVKRGKRIHFYRSESNTYHSCEGCDKGFKDGEMSLEAKGKSRYRRFCSPCLIKLNKLLER